MGLKRVLGAWDAGWLVAGSMIGAGIFYTPGLVAASLPGVAAPVAAWILGGLLALCGAAAYAELGARLPRAGGDYQYLAEAYGPFWGFLTGWAAFTLTFSGAIAVMGIVAVGYVQSALPGVLDAPLFGRLAPPAIVLLLTLANAAGARASGRTTLLLTAIPVVAVIALFGAGLVAGRSDVRLPEPWSRPAGPWPLAFGGALIPIFFAYSGWNTAAYLAEEIRDPARNLARSLLGGTALVTLLYVAFNLAVLAAVPQAELARSTTAGAHAARLLLGPAAERFLAAVIAVAVVGTANVTLMAGSRIYFAMARDRLAPRAFARVDERGVPSTALWAGGAWSAALAASGNVEDLVNRATLAMLLLSSMAVAAVFVLRARGSDPRDPGYRCFGYPWTPLAYIAASAGVAAALAVNDPAGAAGGAALVGTGLPVFAALRWIERRRASRA